MFKWSAWKLEAGDVYGRAPCAWGRVSVSRLPHLRRQRTSQLALFWQESDGRRTPTLPLIRDRAPSSDDYQATGRVGGRYTGDYATQTVRAKAMQT